MLNLFPLPNATDPTGARPVQLRVPDGAGLAAQRPGAAHGLERAPRTRRSTRACSGATRSVCRRRRRCSAPAAAGRRSRRKYQIRAPELRQHAAAHVQPDDVRRVHRRRELGAPEHAARSTRRRRTRNDRTLVLPGLPQFFPQANPSTSLPQASFTGGTAGHDRVVRRRAAVAVLRLQHALQHLGQRDQDQGRAQHEGGPVRRAHDAAGAARVELQRQRSASTPTAPTRSTPTSGSPTRCSARSRSTRNRTATRRRTASS